MVGSASEITPKTGALSGIFSSSKDQKPQETKTQDKNLESNKEDPKDSSLNKTEDKKEEVNKSEICQMQRGDYMIHVLIEQAKDLKIDAEETVDPIVEVKCLGKRKFTTAQKDINNTSVAIWNEHIFFEPKNKETEELDRGKIEIKLMDKGYFKDALIGYYEFDLSYLYQQQKHALLHKWVIMSNPECENFGEVTGLLKISITICGQGDEQVGIEDDPHPEVEDVIQPPQIIPRFFQLKFKFFTAQKIIPMDRATINEKKKSDAYVKLDYKTSKLKTSVQKIYEGQSCTWNQEFLVPAQFPIVGGRLVFRVFDEDEAVDELIGSIHFELKDIVEDANGQKGKLNGIYDWKNIYGSPKESSGLGFKNNRNPMNLNPEIASFWKGRILVQVTAEEVEKPSLLVRNIPKLEIDDADFCLQNRKFSVSCFVAGVIQIPEDKGKYSVSIRIAEKEWTTDLCKNPQGRYNKFNELITEGNEIFEMPYLSLKDIGTLFIYLNHKKKRICYWKGDIIDFQEPNAKLQWLDLIADPDINEVKEQHNSGIVGIKLSIHDVTKNGSIDWMDYPSWSRKVPRRQNIYKLRVFCWQARDLPAADESGSSDPLIIISDTEKVHKTSVIWDNVNPLFYEVLEPIFEARNEEEIPPIIIDVFDKDENRVQKDTEDFLARAIIQVQNLNNLSSSDTIPRPEWHKLYYKKGGPPSGEVLLSFALVKDDFVFKKSREKVRMDKQVATSNFQVQMNILGLRGLQSAGVLPVKKAFLQFNLKSLVPPRLGSDLNNIRTEPKMLGSDPTLNTLIQFNSPLPTDILFCPKMACSVYDNIAMGVSQPLIGTFVIPIGELMHALEKERISETEALEKVVETLEGYLSGEILLISMKQQTKVQQEQNEESLEDQLKKIRINKAEREKQQKQIQPFKTSINDSQRYPDSVPLLQGDYDEEVRMSLRIQEKADNAIDGAKSLTVQQIYDTQNLLKNTENAIRTASEGSQGSRNSFGLGEQIKKFNPKLSKQLTLIKQNKTEKARRDANEARKKAEALFTTGENIVMPQYKFDEKMKVDREIEIPPKDIFIGLGWDEDAQTKRRHYRRFYLDELENIREILPISTPFNQYEVKRGQTRGAQASFWQKITNQVKTDGSGQVNNEQIVGRFKAVIQVEDKDKKRLYLEKKMELIDKLIKTLKQLAQNRNIHNFDLDLEKLETMEGRHDMKMSLEPLQVNHLNIVKKLADIESDVILKRMLLKTVKTVVRVYVIEGVELASRDFCGVSDPYLKLKCGTKIYNERKNYILDEPNPKFNKHFDFEAVFPGCPMLFIEAMDYDLLFGDDLIGTTTIDLEDRYFLPEWRALQNKPVESRQLYHPSSLVSQGLLKMWIEINPVNVKSVDQEKLWDIRAKPPQEFQLRLCIFDTREIKMMDAGGTSDVYIRSFFDSRRDALETDTHYRCQTGNASFNYRLNFKLEVPRKDYRLTIQAFDRDFFKSNDIIGSCMIDLEQAFQDVDLTKRSLRIDKTYFETYMLKEGAKKYEWDKEEESFWVPMLSKNAEGIMEINGYVRIRIDITSMEQAEKTKIGSARDEPNMEPFLPPPIGRLHFSLNPYEMYKQLLGPAVRRKIAIWCCIATGSILCVMIAYYLVPIILGDLISNWISHW